MAYSSGPWRSLGRLAAAAGAVASTSALSASVPNTTADEPIIAHDLDRLLRGQQAPPAAELQAGRGGADRDEHPLRRHSLFALVVIAGEGDF